MKKTSSLILASMLLLGGISTAAPAFAAVGPDTPTETANCHYVVNPAYDETVHHPAIGAVYDTIEVTPEKTVTLYQYTHNDNGNGNSAMEKWVADANWNGIVDGVDHGNGWTKTGKTDTKVIPAETKQVLVKEAVKAYDETIHHEAVTTQELECVDILPTPPTQTTPPESPTPTPTDTFLEAGIPTKPTVKFPEPNCGGVVGELQFPEIVGVHYYTGDAYMGKVIVRAIPMFGYTFSGPIKIYEWEITYVNNVQCVTESPSPSGEPSVAPLASGTPTGSAVVPDTSAPTTAPSVALETSLPVPATSMADMGPAPTVPTQLAYTGSDKTGWALVGGVLVILGLLLVAAPKLMARGKH